ncbi:unnamed protein product [Thelazia callipaeda]|uniref:DAGKc domain-containing protein n=1 Tax=Thelazia callipaeda TaxID=103827 RepID=A0A0N5D6V3_THECL|nr:unnamed protein product [Thelazia callipaeda]
MLRKLWFYYSHLYLIFQFRDCDTKTLYAQKAEKFGNLPLLAEGHLRRITVLADTACAGAFESFRENALPLFNLAGLQVDIIKPINISEFKTIAKHIDSTECDALYIVGGDSTLSAVLSAFHYRENNLPLSIGVFPGGIENRSLVGLVPSVFGFQNDIHSQCESAMALIEEKIRPVYLSRVKLVSIFNFCNQMENSESKNESIYGVTGLHIGWFDRVETNKAKLWYCGPLKRWIAYLTAAIRTLKQYPEVRINMTCEEYCAGCCRCRSQPETVEVVQNRRWWQNIIGSTNYSSLNLMKPIIDYSQIKNENCGKTREVVVNAVDIALENVQNQNACSLRVRTGNVEYSRIGLLMDGWRRCQAKQLSASPDIDFYQNDLLVRSATITFSAMLPDAVKKMTVFGNECQINDLKTRIFVESTNNFVNMYLPSEVRVL